MNTTIEELRHLDQEATPGPWRVIIDDDGNPLSGRPGVFASDELDCGIIHWDGFVQEYWRSARGDKEIEANAALIVAMRNALPELLKALEEARTPRPKDEWHEDHGDVVWWSRFEGEWIGEAAWIGTPNDSEWSGHHTHWTPHPAFPLPPHGGVDVG